MTALAFASFDWLSVLVWTLTFTMTVVLAIRMLLLKFVGKWLSFVCFLIFCAARDVLLALALTIQNPDHRGFAYFWTYWIGQAVSFALQYWVLWQIVRDVTGFRDQWARNLQRCFWCVTALMLVIAARVTDTSTSAFYSEVTRYVLLLDRVVSYAWLLVFIAVAFSAGIMGLWWRKEAAIIAAGFALSRAAESVAAWLAVSPWKWTPCFDTSNMIYLLTLAVWLGGLRAPGPPLRISITSDALEERFRELHISLQSVKRTKL